MAYGGIVGRSENRAMVKVLKLPVQLIARVDFDDYDLICMVDTQPEQGNHSLPARHFPDVVIDHHPERPATHLVPIADVGGPIGATSTLLVGYFRASGLKVPADIATALFYGIKADTRDLGRQTTSHDVDAYLWLFPMVDKVALAQIEHPKLPADYFRLHHTAIEKAQVYGRRGGLRPAAPSTPRTWWPRWPSGSCRSATCAGRSPSGCTRRRSTTPSAPATGA